MSSFGNFIDQSGVTRLRATGGGGGGSSPLVTAPPVTLLPAALLALNDTPVAVVASPGPGKVRVPVFVAWHYKAATTAYATDCNLIVCTAGSWNNSNGAPQLGVVGVGLSSGILQGTTVDRFAACGGGDWLDPTGPFRAIAGPIADFEDNAIVIAAIAAGNPTLGDGSLVVTVEYREYTLT